MRRKYAPRLANHAVSLLLILSGGAALAQPPPRISSPGQSASTPQPAAAAQSALDDPLLQQTDEDDVLTDLFSRITFKYDHGTFNGGSENDRLRISGQQSFNGNRFSLGYEVPFFIDFRGGPNAQSGQGVGDFKVESNLLLWKGERFSHAVRAEFTFPSASNSSIGLGQNLLKLAWGFATPLGSRTVFSGTLAYNKGATARSGQKGIDSFEPEAVLAHEFVKRFAGYLDWDTYEDFNFDRFGQTLKGGFTIQLDRRGRWVVSPYGQFPLNHFTSSNNIKSDSGFDLSWRY